jgi:hypothetical protein
MRRGPGWINDFLRKFCGHSVSGNCELVNPNVADSSRGEHVLDILDTSGLDVGGGNDLLDLLL